MVSVVVVTYDSAAVVEECLRSVAESLPDAEVLVVDNASTDETVASAARAARVVEMGGNAGFARACNRGAEEATRSHVLFLNPDVRVTAVDAARLERLLAERPFGIVAPVLDGEERLRAEGSPLAALVEHTFGALRPRELRPRVRRASRERGWAGGAMLLVRRDEFRHLGGFDERFFLYYEDRDLSRRYRDAGLPIRSTTALAGTHRGGESSAHDGLRSVPIAWSWLSWVEYLWIHEGERKARAAARASLATLRALHAALALVPLPRARRKARQLAQVLAFIRDRAATETEFCPDAIRMLRRNSGPVAPAGEAT